MKFGLITGLLGAAAAVHQDQLTNEDRLLELEAEELADECENYQEIDEDSLLEVDEESPKYKKAIKKNYMSHYGKTKKQIDAENHHILSTQKKCLRFVKKYHHRGHTAVCEWCKKAPAPKIIWKWDPEGKVWYRYYDGQWHYWGPSKSGFTSLGWTWYKGYWHHGGFVYKYVNHKWWRFQNKKWIMYGDVVPLMPNAPRSKRICRPFFLLEKWGFPASLSARKLPRCQVGSGKRATIYMWKDRKSCRFLGGKLVYHKTHECKKGKMHTWKRVTRCVSGPKISGDGLNYRTGKALKAKTKTMHFKISGTNSKVKVITKRVVVLGGMTMGKCYTLTHHALHKKGKRAYYRMKVVSGPRKNTLMFQSRDGKRTTFVHQGHVKMYKNSKIPRSLRASRMFYVIKGLNGGGISIMSPFRQGYFLRRKTYKTHLQKFKNSKAYRNEVTFYPHAAKC